MSKTKLLHQNFLLIFQKSLTSNIFLDPKGRVNPPSPPPCACMIRNAKYNFIMQAKKISGAKSHQKFFFCIKMHEKYRFSFLSIIQKSPIFA